MEHIEYDKTYKYEEIKDIVRQKQLYILDTVIEICEKHGLTYWLDGGTLLGAIRHQGFIPWDDDIDIGLIRDDYEKLIVILPKALPDDLVLQSRQSDSRYKLPFVKIRDKYSQVEEVFEYNGIFIDIFPFDSMPKSALLRKVQRGMFMLLEAMMIYTDINQLNISKKSGFKSMLMKNSMKFLAFTGSFFGVKTFDRLYILIRKISYIDQGDEIGDGLTASWAYYKSIRKKDVYFPTSEVLFEGKKYRAPHDTKAYLTSLYGSDYMTPIKSENHHLEEIIFFNKEF